MSGFDWSVSFSELSETSSTNILASGDETNVPLALC